MYGFLMCSVLLEKSAGSGEKADMERFFGYLGIFTLFGLWWIGNGHFGNLRPWKEHHEYFKISLYSKKLPTILSFWRIKRK